MDKELVYKILEDLKKLFGTCNNEKYKQKIADIGGRLLWLKLESEEE